MDKTTLNTIIGGLAVIVAAIIGIKKTKEKKKDDSIKALKIGYTLIELSRYTTARGDKIDKDNMYRNLYNATKEKINMLCKSLGLNPSYIPDYDENYDIIILSQFRTMFEGLNKKKSIAYEMGITLGNILLIMLPTYIKFSMSKEERVLKYIEEAKISCEKIKTMWIDTFDNYRCDTMKKIKEKIEEIQSKKNNIKIDMKLADEFFEEYEKKSVKLGKKKIYE